MSAPDFSRAKWFKSSRSNGSGGACVEVAFLADAAWRKSSRSNGSGGECVEVAVTPDVVGVRDSKDRSGPVLAVEPHAWGALLRTVAAGRLDG